MLFTNVTFRNNEVNKNASTFGRSIHHYWRSIPGKIDQWILLRRVHWLWVQITVTNEPLKDYSLEVETTQIWWSIKKKNPQLSRKVAKMLLSFSAAYVCETRYSSYTSNKPTNRNRLNDADRKNQLSSIQLLCLVVSD